MIHIIRLTAAALLISPFSSNRLADRFPCLLLYVKKPAVIIHAGSFHSVIFLFKNERRTRTVPPFGYLRSVKPSLLVPKPTSLHASHDSTLC